jgi:hypothetical protein
MVDELLKRQIRTLQRMCNVGGAEDAYPKRLFDRPIH